MSNTIQMHARNRTRTEESGGPEGGGSSSGLMDQVSAYAAIGHAHLKNLSRSGVDAQEQMTRRRNRPGQ